MTSLMATFTSIFITLFLTAIITTILSIIRKIPAIFYMEIVTTVQYAMKSIRNIIFSNTTTVRIVLFVLIIILFNLIVLAYKIILNISFRFLKRQLKFVTFYTFFDWKNLYFLYNYILDSGQLWDPWPTRAQPHSTNTEWSMCNTARTPLMGMHTL